MIRNTMVLKDPKNRRFTPRIPLGVRFVSFVVIAILLVGVIGGFTTITLTRDNLRQEVLDSNLAKAKLAATFASKYIADIQEHIRVFSNRPDVRQAVLNNAPEQLQSALSDFVQVQTGLESSALFDVNGVQILNSVVGATSIGLSYADRDWFQEVIATKQPYQSPPLTSRLTGNPIIPYAVPILDEQGQIHGVLNGAISLNQLSDAIVNIDYGSDNRVSIVDFRDGGIIIAHTDPKRVMTQVSGKNAAVSRLMAGEQGTVETTSSTGELDLIGFAQVPGLPWSVMIITPSATALTLVNGLIQNEIIATGLIMISAAIIGGILMYGVTKPLRCLVESAKKIGEGNLDYQEVTTGNDEVGDLSRAIAGMAQRQKLTLVSRDKLAKEISERVKAEEAIQEREDRYQQLLTDTLEIIQSVSPNGKYLFVNKAWHDLLGYSSEDLQHITLFDVIHPDSMEHCQRMFRDVMNGLSVTNIEVKFKTKDGKVIVVEGNAVPRYLGGNIIATHGFFRDITVRKQTEERLKQDIETETVINGILDLSQSDLSLEEFLNQATELVLSIDWLVLDGKGAVFIIDDDSQELVMKSQNNLAEPIQKACAKVPFGRCLCGRAAVTGEVEYSDALDERHETTYEGIKPHGHYCIPIISGSKILGVMTLYVKAGHRRNEREEAFLWNVAGVLAGVIERKRSEQAILRGAKEWQTTFDSISNMVSIQDRDFKILRVNAAYVKAIGMPKEEIIGKTCFEIVHGTKEPVHNCPHVVTLGTGKPARFEYHDAHKGKYFETSTYPIFDKEGKITGTVHTVQDISERRQAEKNIYLRSRLLDSAMDSIFLSGTAGQILYANKAAAESRGYTTDELLGMNIRQLRDKPHAREYNNQLQLILKNQLTTFETVHVTKDKHKFPVEVYSHPVEFEGEKLVLSVSRDISERRRTEEEQQKLRDKAEMSSRLAAVGEMAAGIAHEINNPLTGVIGFSEMLMERQELPQDIKEDLKIINDGSLRVKEIIKRMLLFAQQSKPTRSLSNITELIDNTLELRSYVLRTANIEVVREYSPDVPWITVDPGQMQQVFLNLIVNAEHAMKKAHDRGRLTIKTEKIGDQVQITFQDDGGGIPTAVKEKLFQPFFTTKAPGEGTGLGLSLSRGIVLEHGGTIEEVGESGKGATFVIQLPITPEPTAPVLGAQEDFSNETSARQGAHILVVDDESAVRAFTKAVLTKNGHLVDESESYEKALEKIGQNKYNVVLLDIRMPGKSGIELYAEIASRWPDMAHRVVFVTGDISDLSVREYLREHNVPWITKPFDRATLEQKVNEMLQSGNNH